MGLVRFHLKKKKKKEKKKVKQALEMMLTGVQEDTGVAQKELHQKVPQDCFNVWPIIGPHHTEESCTAYPLNGNNAAGVARSPSARTTAANARRPKTITLPPPNS